MYGMIMRAKLKRECVRDFYALGKEWEQFHRKRAVGYISSELLWEDREAGKAVHVRALHQSRAVRDERGLAEQNEFYLRMRACFEADLDGYIDRWDSFHSHPPAFATGEPEEKPTGEKR